MNASRGQDPEAGFDLSVFAGLSTHLGQVADLLAESNRMTASQQHRRERLFEQLHQVPIGAIQVPITAGAGAYQMADQLSPKAGYMWSIRRLTASGYTAGTVIAYKNGSVVGGAYTGGGDPMLPFASAGTFTFGRGEVLLDQNDQLILVCTGITLASGYGGVQLNGAADNFERWLLPDYLGIGG
jgi:hypothetical protein